VQQFPNRWNNIPPISVAVFLAAVFLIFSSLGFVGDITHLGRENPVGLAASVFLSGAFAVCYAVAGTILRRRSWIAIVPIFIVHFSSMSALGHFFPDPPALDHFDPQATAHLSSRLNFDGVAIILSVCLSYAGFVHVSIKEGRRYAKAQLEKAGLETEMSAAHEVQSVLVPELLPAIPGYSIESIYHPASQVGGDFFQIIPLPSGATLVAIGDVSGKGLRAAMIVSLILGALRTLCISTAEPASILAELNRQLLGRVHGGFVTCLLMRIDPDGTLRLANAGHLPPYRNGIEIPIPGSLPLGLTENAAYDSFPLQLAVGETLVLLTDGVAEAQNEAQSGAEQLFGFERVGSLLRSRTNVADLAEAARLYGQNDDITLLSLTRCK
jgi:hypothetical protein